MSLRSLLAPCLFTDTHVQFSANRSSRAQNSNLLLGLPIDLCRAYDRAAIKFRGVEADINFSLEDYEDDMKQVMMHNKAHGME